MAAVLEESPQNPDIAISVWSADACRWVKWWLVEFDFRQEQGWIFISVYRRGVEHRNVTSAIPVRLHGPRPLKVFWHFFLTFSLVSHMRAVFQPFFILPCLIILIVSDRHLILRSSTLYPPLPQSFVTSSKLRYPGRYFGFEHYNHNSSPRERGHVTHNLACVK
jgi:hypothetical protein